MEDNIEKGQQNHTSSRELNAGLINEAISDNGRYDLYETCDTNASVKTSIINMTNNVIGPGIVALSYALKQCSLVPGVIILVLVAALSCFSQIIVSRSCRITEVYTFKEMGATIFGRAGGITVSVIMLLYTLGCCMTYMIIIGDLFLGIFAYLFPSIELLRSRGIVLAVVALVIIFPLCMIKTMNSLAYISAFCILFILLTIGVILQQFLVSPEIPDSVNIWNLSSDIFLAIPVMCVCFNCHYNVPRYFYELKGRSPGRMWMMSMGSTLLILLLYLVVSLSGYLHYGSWTRGDVLQNLPRHSILPTIARIGLVIALLFHFPITYFAVRSNIHQLICPRLDFHSFSLRLLTALGVVILSTVTGIAFTRLQVLMSMNGALLGSMIMFIIPGLMYLEATKDEKSKMKNAEAIIAVAIGLFICVSGVIANIGNLWHM